MTFYFLKSSSYIEHNKFVYSVLLIISPPPTTPATSATANDIEVLYNIMVCFPPPPSYRTH